VTSDPSEHSAGLARRDAGGDGARHWDQPRSYYGQPIVKEPAWTWQVPWYLFAGGLAGGASLAAAVAEATGRGELARRTRGVAAGAATASPALLISDLGRPRRFVNMLRVFKPTSAMSMGSWLLAAFGPAATGAAALDGLGWLPTARRGLSAGAAVLGVPLTTYTAVLLSDSANPAWHGARNTLPAVFASSAAASAGGAMTLVGPAAQTAPARRLAAAAAAGEVVAFEVMRHRLGSPAAVFRAGRAGWWRRAATGSSLAGAAVLAAAGRGRAGRLAGAGLALTGAVATRWAVFTAGVAAAREPEHVVRQQRGERR
jgi:hypothetical protein